MSIMSQDNLVSKECNVTKDTVGQDVSVRSAHEEEESTRRLDKRKSLFHSLTDPRIALTLAANLLVYLSVHVPYVFLPETMGQCGLTTKQQSQVMMIVGLSNAIGKALFWDIF